MPIFSNKFYDFVLHAKLFFILIVWGLNYKILPIGANEFGAFVFTLLRFLFTLPILLVVILTVKNMRIDKNDWLRIISIGVVGTTLYQFFFAIGVGKTTATNASVLIAISPVFSFLLTTIIRGARYSTLNWLGLFLAFTGTAFVIFYGKDLNLPADTFLGDIIMFFASFLWALYSFLAEPLVKKYGGLTVTFFSFIPGILGLMFFSGSELVDIAWFEISMNAWFSLMFAVVFVTALGLVFFYQAVSQFGSTSVMTYMFLVPISAIILAHIIFDEPVAIAQVVAALVVIVGIQLSKLSPT